MSIKDLRKRLEWQDWTVLLLIVLIIIFGSVVFSKFQHLPSPLYGGDLYSHYGYAQNYLLNGFWSDPYYPGELPTYPWFGHIMIMIFSFITGLSLMKAFLYFPIVYLAGSLLCYYLLGKQFFKNKTYALFLGILSLIWSGIVDGHPSILVWMIEIPLFLLFWLRFEEHGKRRDMIFTGFLLGLIALTHIAKFMGVLAAFGLFIFVELVRTRKFRFIVKKYAPILVIGAIIASPFYVPNMITYTEGVKNPVFQYNLQPIGTFSPVWIAKTVWGTFFMKKSIAFIAIGIIGLLGLLACALRWKKPNNYLLLIFFIGGMLAPLHHYITNPLLDRWVLPYHLNATLTPILILMVLGFRELFANLKRFVPRFNEIAKIIVFVALLVPMADARWDDYNNDRWVQYGRQMDPLTASWLQFGGWAKQNTNPDDVFLAFDESSFAINSVSARKVMIVRRTHANYFIDIDKRIADAAVIFYGNNNELRKQLLAQYSVDYFLLDPYFYQGTLKTRPEFAEYLKANSVQFSIARDRLDPSLVDAVQYDLAIIPPQNPSEGFMKMLKPIVQFQEGGQNYLTVFRIDLSEGPQK